MPRKARIDAPGALHHLMARGIERRKIFFDDDDREAFLDRAGKVFLETATPCYAWVLLPNHIHLLLKTGVTPISTVMQRLLTGHAAYFNRRHRRYGKLFQSRYKSILCQEEAYFIELVRYIHLNPVRAKIADGIRALDRYRYSGHRAIANKVALPWQDVGYVLGHFSTHLGSARKQYRKFIESGIDQGRRPELIGGGLFRSLGGWTAAKRVGRSERIKSDERILGDGDFVERTLRKANESLEARYAAAAKGFDLVKVAQRVGEVLGTDPDTVWKKGKHPETVQARSLFCFWAVRELGKTATELARQLGLTQAAVSLAVRRGENIASAKAVYLIKE